MLRLYSTSLTIFFSALFLSCSSPDEKRQNSEGGKAYEELKVFVVATEEDAETEPLVDETDSVRLELEVNSLKSQYDHFENKVNQNLEQFSPHQREVLMDLRDRFNIAIKKKQRKFNDANKLFKLRQQVLGVDVKSEDLKEITPDNIRASYNNFVKTVEQDMGSYTEQDWQTIDSFWTDLNSRKEELENDLRPADTLAIARQKQQYQLLNKRKI